MFQQSLISNVLVAPNISAITTLADHQYLNTIFQSVVQPEGLQTNATDLGLDMVDWYELIYSGLWKLLLKLRLLFYLVWPTETMFPSLQQVPRYVAEVSELNGSVLSPFQSFCTISSTAIKAAKSSCSS